MSVSVSEKEIEAFAAAMIDSFGTRAFEEAARQACAAAEQNEESCDVWHRIANKVAAVQGRLHAH